MSYQGQADINSDWGCCYLYKGGGYLPVTIKGIISGLKSGDMNWPTWDHERHFLCVSSALLSEEFFNKYEDVVLPANILDI